MKQIKKTVVVQIIKMSDGNRVFKIRQSSVEAFISIGTYKDKIAVVQFLGNEDIKCQIKMVVGCFQQGSNIEVNFREYFNMNQPLEEICLWFDGLLFRITKWDRDVIRLCKEFNLAKREIQARKKEKEREETKGLEEILQFKNRTMTKEQKLKRRRRKMKWRKLTRK